VDSHASSQHATSCAISVRLRTCERPWRLRCACLPVFVSGAAGVPPKPGVQLANTHTFCAAVLYLQELMKTLDMLAN
jgi:hypothetical protein